MKSSRSKRSPLTSLPDGYPQQMFDKALSDTDYGKRACLQTYSRRTIVISGPYAGQERRAPPAPPKDKVLGAEGGRAVSERWWNCFRGRTRRRIPLSPLQKPVVQPPAYITGHISWVEPGLWEGKKAHFVLLDFAHRRGQEYPERVELDVRVWRAGDAVKSMAEYSHKPLAEVLPPPLAEDLAGKGHSWLGHIGIPHWSRDREGVGAPNRGSKRRTAS